MSLTDPDPEQSARAQADYRRRRFILLASLGGAAVLAAAVVLFLAPWEDDHAADDAAAPPVEEPTGDPAPTTTAPDEPGSDRQVHDPGTGTDLPEFTFDYDDGTGEHAVWLPAPGESGLVELQREVTEVGEVEVEVHHGAGFTVYVWDTANQFSDPVYADPMGPAYYGYLNWAPAAEGGNYAYRAFEGDVGPGALVDFEFNDENGVHFATGATVHQELINIEDDHFRALIVPEHDIFGIQPLIAPDAPAMGTLRHPMGPGSQTPDDDAGQRGHRKLDYLRAPTRGCH